MPRFLLIGLDGAEPSLVLRWMDDGRLPNLAAIAVRGAFLECASTVPPVTFPAWTTCVTGVNPGRHGIVDFTMTKPGARAIDFLNAGHRAAPALWETLSNQGKRVCVLGVPGTYPPDAVNGVMVSGWDSPVTTSVDKSFVYPASEYDTVRDWRFADFQESDIGPGWHDMAHARLLRGIETKERIALDLMRRGPWDFFMIVFGESDTVSHHFWLFHDPNSPRHQPGRESAIRDIYERLDLSVGRLADAMGVDAAIALVSDHGFGGAGTGVVHLNNWLAERGHLAFAPTSYRRLPAGTHEATANSVLDNPLKRAALTLTPPGLRGALFRRFQGLASRAEGQSRFGGIDWANTRAWSEELNYFPSVRINLEGRDPNGQVMQSDYAAYRRDLCAELEAWEVVEKAWTRDEVYTGPYVERAPDIILQLALEDGYSHSCLRARGGPAFRRIRPDEFLGGKERGMNGNHRPTGVFLFSECVPAESCSLLDVAPTVYAALGVAGPKMEGRSLLGEVRVASPTALRRHAAYTPEQEAAVASRLRDLGYFE